MLYLRAIGTFLFVSEDEIYPLVQLTGHKLGLQGLPVYPARIFRGLKPLLWIRDILIRIRIHRSVPLTDGSESGSVSCYFFLNLEEANLTEVLRYDLFVTYRV